MYEGTGMKPTTIEHLMAYGSGGVAVLAGVLTYLGFHIKGITVDPNVAIISGLGIIGAASKADRALAIAAKIFLLCALGTYLIAGANAQTLKAPAYNPPSCPPQCSGFYIGGAITGSGSNVDIVGQGLNGSVFADGGAPSFTAGYMYSNGTLYFGLRGDVGYQFGTNLAVNNLNGSQNGVLADQCMEVGGSLSGIFGSVPAVPITLPLPIISPYGTVCGVEHGGIGNAWATGAGVKFDINQHWFTDVRYLYVDYGSATNGVVNTNAQNLITFSIDYRF